MGERRLPAPSSCSLRRIFLKPCELIALAIVITLFVQDFSRPLAGDPLRRRSQIGASAPRGHSPPRCREMLPRRPLAQMKNFVDHKHLAQFSTGSLRAPQNCCESML